MNHHLASVSLVALFAFGSCDSGLDPDRPIEGGGEIAKGYKIRFDKPESKLECVRLVKNEKGYLAENGPNAIFWRPEDDVTGKYTLAVEVQHLDSHGHPHGAGVIFGGIKLADAEQKYTYFLVRGDGQFLIKTRDGELTEYITTWKPHKAIKSEDDKGVAKNKLAVKVGDKETRFLVNDVEVHRVENGKIRTDGLFGLRIVHNLKVQFAGLRCEF